MIGATGMNEPTTNGVDPEIRANMDAIDRDRTKTTIDTAWMQHENATKTNVTNAFLSIVKDAQKTLSKAGSFQA